MEKIRKTIELSEKAVLHFKKKAYKKVSASAKSEIEEVLESLASGKAKLVPNEK